MTWCIYIVYILVAYDGLRIDQDQRVGHTWFGDGAWLPLQPECGLVKP